MLNDITQIDDFPKLKKLASTLWQEDNSYHGAAIIVGAGFSRSAAITGDNNKKLPLWFSFSEILTEELNSSNSDPLRLAEEYNAYFGKQALHDLIKKEVNDVAWEHGELHKSLLELPWSEVLTTNWDTLLERASEEVHQPVYSIVSKQEDLSSARSPRIVKLHGTIDVTKDLIFSQEDYRKYPQKYAAFVNFARQVFIENELCLLGFSGDDPNFLQWTGWVRDQLATHSRCIYLVGALKLSSSKRKYLESINIAPIDLYEIVKDYDDSDVRHLEATKIFIQTLQNLKPKNPWEWEPSELHRSVMTEDEIHKRYQDNDYAARLLEGQLSQLEKDRLSYPNWLVCPSHKRFQLHTQITDPYPNTKNLSVMNINSRVKLLYEIAWHYKVTYAVLPTWLVKELLTVCNPDKSSILTKRQQLEIALIILKNTRWMNKAENESIIQITTTILEKGKKYWQEINNELAYYHAILARDIFDYPALEQSTNEISENTPIWKLRKASLLAEIGAFDKSKQLITEAYSELLRSYRNNRSSIYLLSQLAWAYWLVRGVNLSELEDKIRIFSFDYKKAECDPTDYLEYLEEKTTKALTEQQEQGIEPLFEPGKYKDKSKIVTFSNELHPLLLLEGISNTVGIPLRWKYTNFLISEAEKIAELGDIDNIHRFALAIRAANSDTSHILNKTFSRIKIACLPPEEIAFLIDKLMSSIEYWCSKMDEQSNDAAHYAIDRLRVFIEILARVSVRATSAQAKQIFCLAVSLGKNTKLHHFWLFDSIKDLIQFSLESISKSEQSEVLLDALSFPLQKEIQLSGFKWGNPIINNPGERKPSTVLDRRIDEIIDNIAFNSMDSAPALQRLLPLIRHQFLTDDECKKIALKIWGENPTYQAIPETGLLNYTLLEFPTHNYQKMQTLIRQYLFEPKDSYLFNWPFLMDLVNATRAENITEYPTEEQAVNIFEKLTSWKMDINENDILGYSTAVKEKTSTLICQALSYSIVPILPKTVLNEENFQKLYALYVEIDKPEILISFPYFATSNQAVIESVEKIIKKNLQSNDANKVGYASYAILVWRDLQRSIVVKRLIKRVIYFITSTRVQGLASLLWTANQMYKKQYLSSEEIESLIEILPIIFDSTDYERVEPYSKESVSISFVRARCVSLAREILNNTQKEYPELVRLLELSKQDPLPEVRFADADTISI
ncbi:SIR2 family NAD-dependent protein deacylase [Actinobacillus equuli]|uniref:SIR2 family NAD-dependent protein deacylase n=1 Tax=Actinobacillus equuli TaxID=718 RepID=UPI0024189CA1|nr:SIR2 family protein [Actinobacillus equuli]MDG4952371.1 SIR2 family protein [Actinobacillus equuli subsp. equuli]